MCCGFLSHPRYVAYLTMELDYGGNYATPKASRSNMVHKMDQEMGTTLSVPSFVLLPSAVMSCRLATASRLSPTYVIRDDSKRENTTKTTTSHFSWTEEHVATFGLPYQNPTSLTFACHSRLFPLIPSTATSTLINDIEFHVGLPGGPRPHLSREYAVNSIECSGELAGSIVCNAHKFGSKPVVASLADGITCAIGVLPVSSSRSSQCISTSGFWTRNCR